MGYHASFCLIYSGVILVNVAIGVVFEEALGINKLRSSDSVMHMVVLVGFFCVLRALWDIRQRFDRPTGGG